MAKFKGSTFQVGDVVEITKESASTGLLDFTEGKGYEVLDFRVAGSTCTAQVYIRGEGGNSKDWYAASHFKLKENTMKSNENHFKVGQTVWDVVYGKGEVVNILQTGLKYPVVVKFVDGKRHFTEDGKSDENYVRTLFFSEPKIIAETEPPFVPTVKKGDVLFTYGKHKDVAGDMGRIVVSSETEEAVFDENDIGWRKAYWEFYKLGEKIEFN